MAIFKKNIKTNKTFAIIQARSTSKRLSNKALQKLGGKTVLGRVVDRIKAVNFLANEKLIDKIIVATPKGDKIKYWCKRHRIDCFEGSENDVLDRYYQCALFYKADYILRIMADCPFLSPELIAAFLMKKPYMEYDALPFNRGKIPDGFDCELFHFDLLKKTWAEAKEREHISREMRGDKKGFSQNELDISLEELDFSGIKLSLDTEEDLRRLEKYAEYL